MTSVLNYNGSMEGSSFIISQNGITTTLVTNVSANHTISLPDASGQLNLGGGLLLYSYFYNLGAQPATVAANQPMTYAGTLLNTAGITLVTGVQGGFSASGSVFQLPIGKYKIVWQQTIVTGGCGTLLYFSTTLGSLSSARVGASAVISATASMQSVGNFILDASASGGYLSVCADINAGTPFAVPANSSTSNQSSATISFIKIA